MSTEHQQYSPVVQQDAIADYARSHGLTIVRTYEDAGISGLTLRERPALIRLLIDVQNPKRDFDIVLVYDVSRWGRFQDVDESGYHEYLCRRAGVQVIYCAESFENDGSPASCIFKAVKRAMASEFSRELSSKVFLAQCLGASRGFHEGGPPGYGLRRMLVDGEQRAKCQLERCEYKNIQTDRTRMSPGPAHEVALVRRMYEWFVRDRLTAADIARRLNSFGIYNDFDRPWQGRNILRMLRSERYIGTNVYNKTSSRLGGAWASVPQNEWIRVAGAFEPLVDKALFRAAQTRMASRRYRPTREEVARGLSALLARTGCLSQHLIQKDRRAPSIDSVMRCFGSLIEAYRAIGYEPPGSFEHIDRKRRVRSLERRCVDAMLSALRGDAHEVSYETHTSSACIDRELRVQIVARAARFTPARRSYWIIYWPDCFPVDLLVFGRVDHTGSEFIDFHVLPRGSLKPGERLTLYEDANPKFDVFRYPDLKVLLELAARSPLETGNERPRNRQHRARSGPDTEPPYARAASASGHR